MNQKNDQIFPLSLAEIAFTIVFILLLLFAYLLLKEQNEKTELKETIEAGVNIKRLIQTYERTRENVKNILERGGYEDLEEIISQLVESEDLKIRNEELAKQLEELDLQITALEEIKKIIESASKNINELTLQEINKALEIKAFIQKFLDERKNKASNKNFAESGEEELLNAVKSAFETTKTIKEKIAENFEIDIQQTDPDRIISELIEKAKNYDEFSKRGVDIKKVQKENTDLRGQLAFLKKRLDARGGRDYPPCWANEEGKVEFLFSVELFSDKVAVKSAWPGYRSDDAFKLPSISSAISDSHSYQSFQNISAGILGWSKKQDPECRHYVYMKSSIMDAINSDRARLMVENYFYKLEIRR